jgi:hypothetical protein
MISELAQKDGMSVNTLEPLFGTFQREQDRKALRLSPQERERRERLDNHVRDLFDLVKDLILEEIAKQGFRRFTKAHLATAERASKELADGLPIGTARKLRSEEIALIVAEATPAEKLAYRVHDALIETPLTVAEVINAAWFHRISSVPQTVKNAFARKPIEETVAYFFDTLAAQDGLTQKSIDIIAFLEAQNDPAR